MNVVKYFSETLNKLFDTEKDLMAAEGEAKKAELEKIRKEKAAKEARATRAKEVEDALKAADAAYAKASQLLKDFTKDYGYFHMSYSTDDAEKKTAGDGMSWFTNILDSFLN